MVKLGVDIYDLPVHYFYFSHEFLKGTWKLHP